MHIRRKKMKINIPITEYKDIEIPGYIIKQITIRTMCDALDLHIDSYIKNGKICYEEEVHSSHSFYREVVKREAADKDVFAIELIGLIKKYDSK